MDTDNKPLRSVLQTIDRVGRGSGAIFRVYDFADLGSGGAVARHWLGRLVTLSE